MLLPAQSNLLKISGRIKLLSCYAKKASNNGKSVWSVHKMSSVLSRLLDISPKISNEILQKHNKLLSLDPTDMEKSVIALKSLQYKESEIVQRPMILYNNGVTLKNRHIVFQECGFENIPIPILAKYVAVMNREVASLKAAGVIPCKTVVRTKLEDCFTDINVKLEKDPGENIPLKGLRKIVLSQYLKLRLNMSDIEMEKLWKTYFRVRHKSFRSILEMIQLLEKDLNFTKERIIKNGFLLHGDPENTKRLITEIKNIGKENIKDILYSRPKIIMSQCDSVLKILEHIRKYKIPEDSVTRCLEILTLAPNTVKERLEDLNAIKELQVLSSNPRVLRLIHYQNKAKIRLNYLNQLRVRCASLHILSCDWEKFETFAKDGSDRTKGKDVIVFLADVLQQPDNIIRENFSRHPNWCHISIVSIKTCYDFLIAKKFSTDDIFHNIHILLYPVKRVGEKLAQLQSNETYTELQLDVNYTMITNKQLLSLCLYLIELEFHFTGDGMWLEHDMQPVENFNNILLDFPDAPPKTYRYGNKPEKLQPTTEMIV